MEEASISFCVNYRLEVCYWSNGPLDFGEHPLTVRERIASGKKKLRMIYTGTQLRGKHGQFG